MSTTQEPQERTPARSVDTAQYIVCAVLVAVGAFLIYDALTLAAGFAKVDPVGPRMFPIVIGIGLIVLAIMLAIAIPRGSTGEEEGGEDIDTSIAGRLAHGGAAGRVVRRDDRVGGAAGLGDHRDAAVRRGGNDPGQQAYVRNVMIGVVLAVGSFYAFYSGLGIPLPAGILDGIL